MKEHIMRVIFAILVWLLPQVSLAGPGVSLLADQTRIDVVRNGLEIQIGLSKAVPFRVFTLNDPIRLVIDLERVEFDNLPVDFGSSIPDILQIRTGLFQPGWGRMVIDLNDTLGVRTAEITSDKGYAVVSIALQELGEAAFIAESGVPENALWRNNQLAPLITGQENLPLVALDAGHGGVDPGARRDGMIEKEVTLQFAQELRDILLATGRYRVLMIRERDEFIPLQERVRLARASGADVMLSLHANTVERGSARGTTVFNLSDVATHEEAEALATVENRADLIAGVALLGEDDEITRVLVDMALRETNVLSGMLADHLAETLLGTLDEGIKSRRMAAGFRVLRAPDIPSVLIELGFMSSRLDRENLQSEEWRLSANAAIVTALDAWMAETQALRALLRK